MPSRVYDENPAPDMASVVERNIHALLERRTEDERTRPRQDRIADAISAFTGSLRFVYIHLALFGTWVIVNLGLTPLPKFDPTFVILATFASVEAIFLSTFVLISQNRMTILADRRADLNLQISLLAEHEVTRLIALVERMAQQLNVDPSIVPDLQELKKDVEPEKVLDRIEEAQQAFSEEENRDRIRTGSRDSGAGPG